MSGVVLDGKKINQEILNELRPRIAALTATKRPPALAVVLVGNDPASQIYVRSKVKTCNDLGIRSIEIRPSENITTDDLIQQVAPLANDPEVDGILVQMPLPKQIDVERVMSYVDASRDVDGFGMQSLGALVLNRPAPRACTPAGILEMLKRYRIPIAGKHAVVVGRSDIVGKPMALLLLHENATVTICHSRTRNLAEECSRADILVAAMGRPAMLTAEYIKPGAIVVDVGTNRLSNAAEVQRVFKDEPAKLASFEKTGTALVGDIDPKAMKELASYYTPVPGGVGPLTIAMLMANAVELAEAHLLQ